MYCQDQNSCNMNLSESWNPAFKPHFFHGFQALHAHNIVSCLLAVHRLYLFLELCVYVQVSSCYNKETNSVLEEQWSACAPVKQPGSVLHNPGVHHAKIPAQFLSNCIEKLLSIIKYHFNPIRSAYYSL